MRIHLRECSRFKNIPYIQTRCCQRYKSRIVKTRDIRQIFLDYYIHGHGYNFTKSSPVVPFCDSTVPFVNAGMNQFKCIFLGTQPPRYVKVANSQKCIRVGGKHNDIEDVGNDGYHHTFFEMLGNWSFKECSKEEVCTKAWKLLTEIYKLDKRRLYVTYFGGDAKLDLEEDKECKEVWTSLGLPSSRIIPFGRSENFWEMGPTGPCGPCSEIHYDHHGILDRPEFVNGNLHDLVELWNLVFIEFNMNVDGTISKLPHKHVDTGMGLERLTAVLQQTTSNYDIDVFQTLFSAIQKSCPKIPRYGGNFGEKDWNFLDRDYRILADHCRMVTASLSDGMIPEQNQKLRRILRRCFAIASNTFNKDVHLIKEMIAYVVDSLGIVYPEMEKNYKNVVHIIEYEAELYNTLRKTATDEWKKLSTENSRLENLDVLEMPGIIAAYKDIKLSNIEHISPEYGYKLYDTFGLDNDTITALCDALDIKYNIGNLEMQMDKMKLQSKSSNLIQQLPYEMSEISKLPTTDDSFKYEYFAANGEYNFIKLPVQILMVIDDSHKQAKNLKDLHEYELILDKTNLYVESGGQMSDRGSIDFECGTFTVHTLKNINGYIFHKGLFKSKDNKNKEIDNCIHMPGLLTINEEVRLQNMRNHTCVHLINASFKQLKSVTCQKSSKVTNDYCNLDISCFCDKVNLSDIAQIEEKVKYIIMNEVPVNVQNINSQDLLTMDNITVVPGEVYPETGIRLIDIKHKDFHSREPCCGTHVLNTNDLVDMCMVAFRSLGRSTSALYAVTGTKAQLAIRNGAELMNDIKLLKRTVEDNSYEQEKAETEVGLLRQRLNYDINNSLVLPILVKDKAKTILDSISKQIKLDGRGRLREFIDMEMKNAIATNKMMTPNNNPYLIHYLRCSMMMENVSLQRATSLCEDVPVIVISFTDSIVKARCCIPEKLRNEEFTADKWLMSFCSVMKSALSKSPGQDATLVCQMKAKKISMPDWDCLLKDAIKAAKMYADMHI